MQQHCSKYFACRHTFDPGVRGQKVKKKNSESSHVAYRTKGNGAASSLVLVLPMNTRPCLTERLLMGHKESNQTNKQGNGA